MPTTPQPFAARAKRATTLPRVRRAHRQRAAGKPTIPSRLGDEKRANPFLLAKDAVALADVRGKKDRF